MVADVSPAIGTDAGNRTVRAGEFALMNDYQRGFPIEERPFLTLARATGHSEETVLATYRRWLADGTVSRIGAVVRPGIVDAGTLACMAVPARRLEAVAALVSRFPEVNHNYEREHRLNLWFVASAPDRARLDRTLSTIERLSGLEVVSLPLECEYRIDLGFDLRGDPTAPAARTAEAAIAEFRVPAVDRELLTALEDGLSIEPRPFAAVAERVGDVEDIVRSRLRRMVEGGVVRRFGVVLRHRRLGYGANAMVVFDVPDDRVDALGRLMAASGRPSLCYRRARVSSRWPYNLYCMLHGRERADTALAIDDLRRTCGAESYPFEALFSSRCFKQRGARFLPREV